MIEQDKVSAKLASIAEMAEDLSAELFSDSPETAQKFGKIAKYCRRIGTCVRLYGQLPVERQGGNPIIHAAKTLDVIIKNFRSIADHLPRD